MNVIPLHVPEDWVLGRSALTGVTRGAVDSLVERIHLLVHVIRKLVFLFRDIARNICSVRL